HLGAFADDEDVLGEDLARDLSVHPDRPLEGKLAFELAAPTEQRGDLSRSGRLGRRAQYGGGALWNDGHGFSLNLIRLSSARRACQCSGRPKTARARRAPARVLARRGNLVGVSSARGIIHVDMDAFYASVEQRDRPELGGKPVIVGGHAQRGVVLAASYEVRRFGVRSAMSMVEALRRAPQAIVVPPRFSAYVAASEEIGAIFERYTPLVEPLSLDEAFLDVTASRGLFGDAAT